MLKRSTNGCHRVNIWKCSSSSWNRVAFLDAIDAIRSDVIFAAIPTFGVAQTRAFEQEASVRQHVQQSSAQGGAVYGLEAQQQAQLHGGMSNLSTLVATVTARQEIKKSRFIAVAGPVPDEATAKDFIAAHSNQTANHNCWAWRIGQAYRFSDDGEPSGTAGKPMLQAIDGQALDRVAVVVTRWFGGVLLGSGGLIRAYGGTAAMCLREAEKMPLVDTIKATVRCGFSDLAYLRARLEAVPGVQIRSQAFADTGAELSVLLPKGDADSVARMVADLTSGRAAFSTDD